MKLIHKPNTEQNTHVIVNASFSFYAQPLLHFIESKQANSLLSQWQ